MAENTGTSQMKRKTPFRPSARQKQIIVEAVDKEMKELLAQKDEIPDSIASKIDVNSLVGEYKEIIAHFSQ